MRDEMKSTKTLKKGTQRTRENRIDTKHIKGEEKILEKGIRT
jgi:hypothetical protein